MAEIIFITGGCRSGKSSFAVASAKKAAARVCIVATAEPLDPEMKARIRKHKKERPSDWKTIEEPLEIGEAVSQALKNNEIIIVDCLALWVSNLMGCRKNFNETTATQEARKVIRACRQAKGTVFFVTNETGLGIVPADPVTRRYRDCLGRINQIIAKSADRVILLVSGIPINLKGQP